MSAERLARAALARVVEPGDVLVGRWLGEFGAVAVWEALSRRGRALPGASAERWAGWSLRAERAEPAADLARIAELGGRFLCPGDREWPRQLADLGPAAPIGLWVRGPCSLRFVAVRAVALVGARACTDYGSHVTAELATGLAERGWTVVSGAAFGIDGAAHRGALAVSGVTVAVLACGVDVSYPLAHRELLDRIARGGLLVAELAPGDHPTRARFVQRNRVIAALTRGTVVVEAARRSGALNTARHATELGRHLMAVPGPVTSGLSAGAHRLIRAEATLVSSAAEIIELVGEMGELAAPEPVPLVPRDLLAPRAAAVLDALPVEAAASLREVAREACTGEEEARARLGELVALGFVERVGEHWRLPTGSTRHARVVIARAAGGA
ncbi:DNA-processing protein DprA [Streptomyces sp. DSM 44915]|uniref:DNA-processing protein DprA n=1 Tax=Streptomyces chisholmiae TaxID=3075540 RepID=A0ABU2JWK2_9ACTN|nr:DNA-processing protein DprA [Streptomyces sp. DSM 44915]MDT0269330.1 DNA-processing protein DprA [Streptomyces sp. DSM 44915]